jgi:hypothetical protein
MHHGIRILLQPRFAAIADTRDSEYDIPSDLTGPTSILGNCHATS